jgi:NAD-dependent SIR2 family protein deacetylase
MRKVFFVGAGAAVPFGLPPTAKILPRALARLQGPGLFFGKQGRGAEEEKDEQQLLAALRDLYPGLTLTGGEDELAARLPSITDILSFLDYLLVNEQPAAPRWTRERMEQMRRIFDRAICEVLSWQHAPSSSDEAAARTPVSELPQGRAWELLQEFLRTQVGSADRHVTVITTNYDLTMDTALSTLVTGAPEGLLQIDLGFELRDVHHGMLLPRPRLATGSTAIVDRLALFKLHGSLNYLRCELCDQVYVNPAGSIAYLAFSRQPTKANTCHCGQGPLRHVIVAPSLVRTYRLPQLLATWAAATEALRRADEWIFVGYSLPPEDLAIRSLLFRAWHARGQHNADPAPINEWPYKPKPNVTVVQYGNVAKPAYDLLFGKHLTCYFDAGFDAWLEQQVRAATF